MSELLEAEAQLRSLANRYADAINRADFTDLGQCWAPDGVWRVPEPFNILQSSREAITSHLADRRATVDIVVMTVGSVIVTEAGDDRIVGRTTIEEQGRRDMERGIKVLGLYDDVLTKIDGTWYFATRTLQLLAVDNSPTVYVKSPSSL